MRGNSIGRKKADAILLVVLLTLVVGIGFLHSITPGSNLLLHDVYRRLGYFPIVVAAIRYGIRGGLIVALGIILSFIPHLRHFYLISPSSYLVELPEILLYLAAGVVTGAIAGREKRLRVMYQDLSEKLEHSYNRLHQETALLLEVEEQLRASQKLSALGQLSASLAHEIKNPLAGIRGAAEILLDTFPAGHEKREFAEIVLKETGRLGVTVDEVLNYSRDQQKSIKNRPQAEALSVVMGRVLTLVDNQLRKKNISLQVNIPDAPGGFMVDGNKMAQVFINLLLNSCEALDRGGAIRIDAVLHNQELVIAFSDNGPGVPESERQKIFTPFYSSRQDGTGLGLAISSRIVESYGGRLTFHAPEDGGACFTVSIPASENAARETALL